MSYTMQEGQFSLFKNERKESAAQPDYYGSIMVNGKEMRLAAWMKEGKTGKFLSGKLSEIDKTKSVQNNLSKSDDAFF